MGKQWFRLEDRVALVTGSATGLGAAAVIYLASEEVAMVNATTLSVDGGWTAW